MKKAFLFLLILQANSIFSQNLFQKTLYNSSKYYTLATDFKATEDKGYVLLETDDGKCTVLKIDSLGFISWAKTYTDKINRLYPYSLGITADNGYVITGLAVDSNGFNEKTFFIKTDKNGSISLAKIYNAFRGQYGKSVFPNINGGFTVCGSIGSDTLGKYSRAFLINTDSQGNILTSKKFESFFPNSTSGNSFCNKAKQTIDGNVIMIGSETNADSTVIFLLKTNTIGEVMWCKSLIYGPTSYTYLSDLAQTQDGGYIITGYFYGYRSVLIKTDAMGNIIWSRVFDGSNLNSGNCVIQTSDLGYAIGGWTTGFGNPFKAYLIKTDTSGNVDWSRLYNEGHASVVIQDSDNNYLLAGKYQEDDSVEIEITSLIKMDVLGHSTCDIPLPLNPNSNAGLKSFSLNPVPSGFTAEAKDAIFSTSNIPTKEMNCSTTAITELSEIPKIAIYPNPSSGKFTFERLPPESLIDIFDVLGNLIFQSISISDNLYIDIGGKLKGIYFYRITSKNKGILNGKISLE